MNELTVKDKDTNKDNRKNSMLLPSGRHDNMLEGKIGGSSLAAAGSNVIGGEANYKRF